jgi:multiple sugar transport system ATP-binding protein
MSSTAGGIDIEQVTKVFARGVRAVDEVSLAVEESEFMVLVGPSGCGKTTLLKMIAGLEPVSGGRILIGGKNVTYLPPRQRDIAMVFQTYALYPHMDVRKNLGYALKVRGTSRRERKAKVEEVARLLGLEDLLDRKPAQLSGGQRQRVAMGRAIVREPAAFLMDEPLSNLDAKLRVGMRAELARLHDRLGVTTVYVTHDQVEAMTLGQRVAVMREGQLQQVGTPRQVYREPANLFVAAFIGSPPMNLVSATLDHDTVEFAGFRIPLDREVRPPAAPNGRVILGIRPESFEDVAFADAGLPQIDVSVAVVEELGSEVQVVFPVDAPPVETEDLRAIAPDEEEETPVLLHEEVQSLFTAALDPRTDAKVGAPLRLTVDPGRFYYFSPDTGVSLTTPRAPVAATV